MSINLGLYESMISKLVQKELSSSGTGVEVHMEQLEPSVSDDIISSYIKNILKKGLSYYSSKSHGGVEKQIEIANRVISLLSELVDDRDFKDFLISEDSILKKVLDKNMIKSNTSPVSSISGSTLFTGSSSEPSVYSELSKEILNSDRIDLLVSFIKFSGLRLLIDALKEHTKSKKLRVITTSYMGASDYKAIKLLSELPNTEVKISYDTKRTRLHAKAYYFYRSTGFSTAYIGSSNMSKSALSEGTEWNLKVSEYSSPHIIEKYRATFESYWNSSEFQNFDPNSIEDNILLKESLSNEYDNSIAPSISFDIRPFGYQQEMLDRLEVEREIYNSRKNLLVAATGTGKTVVSAFDFKRYLAENKDCKLLFISHREEILGQSLETFRWILKDHNFGDIWVGSEFPSQDMALFASIQTLYAGRKYMDFDRDHFDFIVLDETHHVTSRSYDSILSYFCPHILLGLTATPERMDGGDILKYFNNRIAYEVRLHDAIERNLLCPFHYFGISDCVKLDTISWARGAYDVSELDRLYTGNDARAQLIVSSVDKYLDNIRGVKGIGFCVSKSHARYMSSTFNARGISSISLDSTSPKSERATAKSKLQCGDISFIFVVDLYNEGVDIPEINTVLFLRPTESSTVFLQQLGRGLRLSPEKEVLTVLDFVGQSNKEYSFREKLRCLVGKTASNIEAEIKNEFPMLPSGCSIKLERKASEYILENLKQTYVNKHRLKKMISNFKYQTDFELNLSNFISHYNLDILDLYKSNSLYGLSYECNIVETYIADDKNKLKNALKKIALIDSRKWLLFLIDFLNRDSYSLDSLSKEEYLMLLMFHYTVWGESPDGNLLDFLYRLKENNTSIFDEIVELLKYGTSQIDFLEKSAVLGFDCPLCLHSRYSTDQVLSALGVHTEEKKQSFREGALHVKEKHLDVFFITLNKSEAEFSASTRYDDYAISDTLFHWQSQSRTSISSPTGQRYINHRELNSSILIFVRENKRESSITSPFYFLGKANYLSHSGSKPISFVWELDHPMPVHIQKKSKKAVSL